MSGLDYNHLELSIQLATTGTNSSSSLVEQATLSFTANTWDNSLQYKKLMGNWYIA